MSGVFEEQLRVPVWVRAPGGALEAVTWIRMVALAGSVGLGQTLHSRSPTPALGLSCPLLWAQTFLTLPSPPSDSVGAESVFGAHSPARLQARKCQAGPWPPHPVICSFRAYYGLAWPLPSFPSTP